MLADETKWSRKGPGPAGSGPQHPAPWLKMVPVVDASLSKSMPREADSTSDPSQWSCAEPVAQPCSNQGRCACEVVGGVSFECLGARHGRGRPKFPTWCKPGHWSIPGHNRRTSAQFGRNRLTSYRIHAWHGQAHASVVRSRLELVELGTCASPPAEFGLEAKLGWSSPERRATQPKPGSSSQNWVVCR